MVFPISVMFDLCVYIMTNICTILNFRKSPESLKCLTGKTAIVTGGNAGIGFAVATKLASRGCKVILADCQNGEQARDHIKQITGNMEIVYKHLDLSSLHSVRCFASDICQTEAKIDILLNNAGIGLTKEIVSEDGLNYLMQVNIFGAFLLTHLLLDPLKKSGSAQVLFTSSIAALCHSLTLRTLNPIDFQMNVDYQVSLYCNSKLCNILAAQEFGNKLKKYGIAVNAIDPIGVLTQIFDHTADFEGFVGRIFAKTLLPFTLQDMRDVANSYLYVITKNHKTTGQNYVMFRIRKKPKILNDVHFCEAVWTKMEDLVQLKPEHKIAN